MDQDIKVNSENVLFKPDMSRLHQEISEEVNTNINTNLPHNMNPMNYANNTMSMLNRSSMMTYSKIICCICSATIEANAKGMCATCARAEVNITEGITKSGLIYYCKGCDRYMRPPWVRCGANQESPEMMAFCLSKIKGLNKVKLVDSSFVWTEPHSKLIKVKLTVQKEMNKSLVETSMVVEFKVEWTQCDDCKKTFTPHVWSASVQIRQKVNHKRTFLYLEQLVLKHKAHAKALNVKEHPEGVDFYFSNKSQALALSDFIRTNLPAKVKQSRQLISHDQNSNIFNYKYTFMIEIAPVCKEDLIVLDKETSKELGGAGPVMLCYKLSSRMHLIDPLTFQTYEFDGNTYWRHEFRSYVDRKCLQEFLIINVEEEIDYNKKYSNHSNSLVSQDVEMASDAEVNSKINQSKSTYYKNTGKKHNNSSINNTFTPHSHFKIVNVQCILNNQDNSEVKLITIRSHLGGKIRPGDIFLGYDLTSLNVNDELQSIMSNADSIPDIILVKKKYVRSENKRLWKLKHLNKDVDMNGKTKNAEAEVQQYEEFLRDIEEDKEMRKGINLYKDDEVIKELEGKFKKLKVNEHEDSEIDIKVDELLDDLHIADEKQEMGSESKLKKNDSIDVLDREEEFVDTQFEKPNPKGQSNKKQIGKRDRRGNKIEEDD